jgi:hypothetical protein
LEQSSREWSSSKWRNTWKLNVIARTVAEPEGVKGSHTVMFQTLFGNLELCSPRWNHCGCRPNPAKTFSPLLELLDGHVSPERLYLETKWASLISFELAAHLLKDTLPVAETVNAASVRNHLHRVAERSEAALGDEKVSFIEGCPREWAALPHPQPPLTVGIDGCYVRQWEDKKAHFEMIVGKSMAEDGPSRCFGFVQTYDEKPKRRLFGAALKPSAPGWASARAIKSAAAKYSTRALAKSLIG